MTELPKYSIAYLFKTDDEIETIYYIKENIDFIKSVIKNDNINIDVSTIDNLQLFLQHLKEYFSNNYIDLLPNQQNYFLYYEHILDIFTLTDAQRLEKLDDFTLVSFINIFNIIIIDLIDVMYSSLENIKENLKS